MEPEEITPRRTVAGRNFSRDVLTIGGMTAVAWSLLYLVIAIMF